MRVLITGATGFIGGAPATRLAPTPVPRPEVPPELREELAPAFRVDAERLRAFSGLGFASWSV